MKKPDIYNFIYADAARQIGQRIYETRKRKNMKQKDLALLADIPYQTLSAIENGNRLPSAASWIKIAIALGVGLCELQPFVLDCFSKVSVDAQRIDTHLQKVPSSEKRKTLTNSFISQIKENL